MTVIEYCREKTEVRELVVIRLEYAERLRLNYGSHVVSGLVHGVTDAAGKDLEQAKAGLADAKADASEKDEAYQSAIKAAQDAQDALDKAKADAVGGIHPEAPRRHGYRPARQPRPDR